MSTRANIHLDNEAYNFASMYARARGLALGAAISEILLERADRPTSEDNMASGRLIETPEGLLVVAGDGKVITSEMVKRFSEDELD